MVDQPHEQPPTDKFTRPSKPYSWWPQPPFEKNSPAPSMCCHCTRHVTAWNTLKAEYDGVIGPTPQPHRMPRTSDMMEVGPQECAVLNCAKWPAAGASTHAVSTPSS